MKISHVRYAENYAKNMVNDYKNNPEYHGPAFKFEKLPDMIMRLAKTSAFMNFPNIKSCDEVKIGTYAKEFATKLLKEKQLI